MKRYIAFVGYDGKASVMNIFLLKEAFDDFVSKAESNERCSDLSTEIRESKQPYETIRTTSPFITLHTEGLVRLKDVSTSPMCSDYDGAFTLPEFVEQAKEEIEGVNKSARFHADSYYSRPWV